MKKSIIKKICLLICVVMLGELFAVVKTPEIIPVQAATASQNNIVARADYLYDKT